MKQLHTTTLLDALAVWGAHEAAGRYHSKVEINTDDKFRCADFILRYRAPLAAQILLHNPRGAIVVELEPKDSSAIFLADGRTIEQWIADVEGDSEKHYRRLCEATDAPCGPLIGAIHQSGHGPIILFDGWHRAAAWFERCRSGRPASIEAQLIIFKKF